MSKVYVKGVDQDHGPFESHELHARGVTAGTLLRQEGSDAWMEASELPGFSAARADAPVIGDAGPYWGDITPKQCNGGTRLYSAILWGIPFGQSWEAACAAMPATINGVYYPHPTRCVNTGLNMWGEWDVPDGSCGGPSPSQPPVPAGDNTLPQCTLKYLWFNASSYFENGKTYPAFSIYIALRRSAPDQASCRCPVVSQETPGLTARLAAFASPGVQAQGFWVFKDARSSNEFSFGTWDAITPMFVPMGPMPDPRFELGLLTKGPLGARSYSFQPGSLPVTQWGLEVPPHRG